MKTYFKLLLFSQLLATNAFSQISLLSFSTGYYYPVDIKNCGDSRLFIVQQNGLVYICDSAGNKNPQPFFDIRNKVKFVGSNDERGLLGLAFAPDFRTSGYFYVDYVGINDGRTHIARFRTYPSTSDSADPATEETLLTIFQPFTNHKGGHLAFGHDGYLYIGMGDGGSAGDPGNRAQNPDSLLGKILRIEVNPSIPTYNIPPDNPFADGVNGRPEVWSLGIRNPWRWSFDRLTGDLWIGDVGQNLIEEIDFQPFGSPGGLNYGWRCYEANAPYNTSVGCLPYSAYVPNVFQYNHTPYCSVTGGYIYRGSKFQELYGKYFFADYCRSEIRYLEANSSGGFTQTNLGLLGAASVSGFGEDAKGEVYCAGLGSGIIYHIVSANCAPVATINAGKDTVDDCGSGSVFLSIPRGDSSTWQWQYNGSNLGTDTFQTATQQGIYTVTVTRQSCTSTDSIYVKLSTPPVLNFAGLDTLYCIYDHNVILMPSIPGGKFSGPGTNDTIYAFSPALAGVGFHTVTYNYKNAYGCTYSASKNVHVDACSGIPENLWLNTITVYPNPSSGKVYLEVFSDKERRFAVLLTDVSGRKIMEENFVIGKGQNGFSIKENLASGIYVLKLSDENSSVSKKVIVH